jgi:eukaryotic-like serine/threonine-protein kinase
MNHSPDPHVTSDFSPVPADASRKEPLSTRDDASDSSLNEGSRPGTGDLPAVPGYRVLGEIARGGMGRVLAAHDLVLERDVALKILLPGANADRFVRESKITARLPHPGIPPVHALGTLDDGSPFLAMKLIAGQTLADAMKAADRPRLLHAFTQVCQAVGFAHSRGVIHRDLKPANVMVGAFGEVQVMDWGLAKEVTDQESAAVAPAAPVSTDPGQTTDFRPADTADEQTEAGMILGTPGYMAPEQARGEATDARTDVFALGGMLCTILTGAPPFRGTSAGEVIHRAATADLAETHARLDGCGADTELLTLCRHCLVPRPEDRPADGQAVADGMTAYLSGVQDRLHAAERERAVAAARGAEQRKRRRLVLALAATVLLAVTLGGGVWLWWKLDRDARTAQATRDVLEARNQAIQFREQAKAATADAPALYARAREQAQRALALAESGSVDEVLTAQVRDLQAELDQEEKDQQLIAALDAAQLAHAATVIGESRFALERAVPKYREALQAYGLPAGQGEPGTVAARILQCPVRVRATVLAALNDWIDLAADPRFGVREPNLEWLRAVVMAIEPQDDWTKRFRAACKEKDKPKRRAALEKLVAEPDVGKLPASSLERLAVWLQNSGAEAAALRVRRLAQQRYPGDFRANQLLAAMLQNLNPPDLAQTVRFLTVAVALRPDSPGAHLNLGNALHAKGDGDEAIACYRRAIELDARYAAAHANLGVVFGDKSRLEEAIACFHKAIELDPQDATPHYLLGNVMRAQGKPDEAIACFRAALARDPKLPQAHVNLGLELADKGRLDEAIACYHKAIELAPKLVHAHLNLGLALSGKGDGEGAIACYRKVIEIDPQLPMAHGALGQTLLGQGRYAEARDATARAMALLPEKHPMREMANRQLKNCERLLKVEERLSRLLSGEERASSAQENLEAAQLARRRQLHAAATRFTAAAFAADPGLASNLQAMHRFDAACSAALAADGQGADAANLDDAARKKLRAQALDWLVADLAACAKLLDSGSTQARTFVVQTMSRWQKEPELSSLRDAAALAQLPPEERTSFTRLWATVAELLKKAEAPVKKGA